MENYYSKKKVTQLLELAWATASAYGNKTDSKDCADWIEKNLIGKETDIELKAKELFRALDLMTNVFWPNGEAELGYVQESVQAYAMVALERNINFEPSKEDRKVISSIFRPLVEAKKKEFEEADKMIKKIKIKFGE